MEQQTRPPLPPFDEESARQKVKAAQDAWNTLDPEKVLQRTVPGHLLDSFRYKREQGESYGGPSRVFRRQGGRVVRGG
jgi:nuclear transport factor 2 (NTF2) superfamily protein